VLHDAVPDIQNIGSVSVLLVVILAEMKVLRGNGWKKFFRECEQAEGVAAIVGDGRVLDDLIGSDCVLAFHDVLKLESPDGTETVDHGVADRGDRNSRLNIVGEFRPGLPPQI